MSMAIDIQGISKSYGDLKAVDNLNLQVEKGSVYGFLGPNGAGKTTTIKMLLGLLSTESGTGEILGYDIEKDSLEIRKRTGYVPEVDQLYDYMKVKEIINFNKGFFENWDDSLVKKYNRVFNLPLQKKVKELSLGMKKQLALILALGSQPELLILDEPTSGLDPVNRQEILRIILEEISVEGKTVFFSSHLLSDVERIADSVAIIKNGKIVDSKLLDDLKTDNKKIRVVFQQDPDTEVLSLPGIENYSKEKNAYIFTVSKNLDNILKRLKQQPHFTLEIIDQDLEEIFMEKVRGDKNEL